MWCFAFFCYKPQHLIVSPRKFGRTLIRSWGFAFLGFPWTPLQQIDLSIVEWNIFRLDLLFLGFSYKHGESKHCNHLKTHFSCGTRCWDWVKDNLGNVEVSHVWVWPPLDCQESADLQDLWDFAQRLSLRFHFWSAFTRYGNDTTHGSWWVPWCAELNWKV